MIHPIQTQEPIQGRNVQTEHEIFSKCKQGHEEEHGPDAHVPMSLCMQTGHDRGNVNAGTSLARVGILVHLDCIVPDQMMKVSRAKGIEEQRINQ
jgi:hypothetical protein